MGIVQDFFIHTFGSQRYNTSNTLATVLSNQPCLISKIQDQSNNQTDGYYGMERRLYCNSGLDIRIGDILTSDGVQYSVRGEDANIPDMFEGTDDFSAYVIIKTNQ